MTQDIRGFDDLLASASAELRLVCKALRSLITSQHPTFYEIIWPKLRIASYGVGPKKMSQHYAYIAVQPKHINLGFYYGATLNDPETLMVGTGKLLRHIKIRDAAAVSNRALIHLLFEAIKDRQPYA